MKPAFEPYDDEQWYQDVENPYEHTQGRWLDRQLEGTVGAQIAAEARTACNSLTAEQRTELLAHGMSIINASQPVNPRPSTPE